MWAKHQLTRKQAQDLAASGECDDWPLDKVARFQLYQERLCVDFGRFQEAVEKVLGRSVWTHEFADTEGLQAEYEKRRTAPTMREIIGMLPKDKVIVLVTPEEGE